MKLNFWYYKVIRSLHPGCHSKKIGDILINVQKKGACFNEGILLMTMKMRLKMKNRSHNTT